MRGEYLVKKDRDILQRMSFMKRFNNEMHFHDENVAEHSFYVSVFAMMLCDELAVSANMRRIIIEKAIIHDIHEVVISDVPHNVKMIEPSILKFYTNYESKYNAYHFASLVRLYDSLVLHDRQVCDEVVTLADILSVIQYAQLEVSLGNKKFEKILEGAWDRVDDCFRKLTELEVYGIDRVIDFLKD